jgi:hypothetical protein
MSDLAKLHQSEQALAMAPADLDRTVELRTVPSVVGNLDTDVAQAASSMAPSLRLLSFRSPQRGVFRF